MKMATCHPEQKYYSKGLCRTCYEKQLKEANPEYKQKQQENSKNWHIKNKEYKSLYDKKRRSIIGSQTERRYFNHIKQKFGLSKEDYENMVNTSNNACYICGKSPYKNKKLHLDHCHKTGKVRGLLCTRCNWYLATIEKDITILDKIKIYLDDRGN